MWFSVILAGVFPSEWRSAQRSEWPGWPQPADRERGEGFLHGALSALEAAEGGRDGQTRTEGHTGLRPGKFRRHSDIIVLFIQTGTMCNSSVEPDPSPPFMRVCLKLFLCIIGR